MTTPPDATNQVINELKNLGTQLAGQNATQNIEKFHGEKNKVRVWLRAVEKEAKLTTDTDANKIRLAYQTCDDIPSTYLDRYYTKNPNATWAEIKKELISAFGEVTDASQAQVLLRKYRQKSSETIQLFGERVREMAEIAFEGHDLDDDIVARQVIDIFVDGLLKENIARKVLIGAPISLSQAVSLAVKEQMMQQKLELRFTHRRGEEEMEIGEVIKEKDTHERRQACFGCGKLGHRIRECKTKRKNTQNIQCYNCSNWGHIAKQCRFSKNGAARN